jgi:PAS domain S-box-containing protein
VPAVTAPAAYLEALLDSISLAAYLKDRDGKYLWVNRQYERLSKAPRAAIAGLTDPDLFPEPVARLFREQDLEVMARRTQIEFDETIPLPDGVFSFITAKFPLLDERGEPYAVGGICTDITSRKRQGDETLAAERERLAVTLRSIGDAVVGTDTDGNVTLLNPVAERLTGYSQAEAAGRPVEEIARLGAGDVGPVRAVLAGGAPPAIEDTTLTARGGEERFVTGSAAPVRDRAGALIGAVLSLRDVTEQRRMAEELFQARRLESIGLLAGGIAHDFNNLLEGILGNLDLAALLVPADTPARAHVDAAERAALRARGLTRQLLTFARGGDPVKELSAVADIIRESAAFALTGSNVSCEFTAPPALWLVDIDRAQLSQVVQNLAINARQAMPEGGTVRIRCDNVDGGAAPEPAAGRQVLIEVEDDGPGIPTAIVDRIFDPYFTTKAAGSGLGLAVAHAVIQKHGGRIVVGATPAGGARFTILLPASDATLMPAPSAHDAALGRLGRVLLMDDDPDVLDVTGEMLRQIGFETDVAPDGDRAVAAFRAARLAGAPFDLVLMDLTVPGGLGGVAAVRAILADDPTARVVVSSGYSDDPCLAHPGDFGFVAAVAKPYTLDELRRKLAAVLPK